MREEVVKLIMAVLDSGCVLTLRNIDTGETRADCYMLQRKARGCMGQDRA